MLLTMLFSVAKMNAQVTIGADVEPNPFSILELYAQYDTDTYGGLRLPQMTTVQRNGLFTVTDKPAEAKGLVIYNLDNNCVEYWNDTKWVSLCTGQAAITFEPGDPTVPMFPFVDTTRGPFTPHDEPDCVEQNPAYNFVVISGADYLHIRVMNEATGQFTVTMDANPTAHERIAIVRIINNCTQEYKDFIFTQAYDVTLCNTSATPPTIVSSNYNNGTSLCGGGAVYLRMTAPADSTGYVWARNGLEVARNVSNYIATVPGTYKIYAGAIGCESPIPATINVTAGTSGAPAPVFIIVGENNGYVCSESDTITLFASSAGGKIVWYKNGVKTDKIGEAIRAGIGTWFAVVENGECSSLPSNTVRVMKHPETTGAPITPFHFTVNGELPVGNSIQLCSGGSLLLEVVSPEPGVTYTWYAGDSQNGLTLGSGPTCVTTVSAIKLYPILQCVGDKTNSCTQAQYTKFTTSTVNPPARPAITSNTGNAVCGSGTYLTATSIDATSYLWYKDGIALDSTTSSIAIDAPGIYTVYAVANGCVSEVSRLLNISVASGFADNLTISGNLTPTINAMENYTATMTNTTGAVYTWSIHAPHTIISGQGSSSITVRFGAVTGADTLRVNAINACGDAMPKPAILPLTVSNPCIISIQNHYPPDRAVIVQHGTNPIISITANSPSSISYQWYRNVSPSTAGAVPVGANSAALTGQTGLELGTHYFYCVATANCGTNPTATSGFFTVTVIMNPALLPAGNGTLAGKSCFDIARSTCESLAPDHAGRAIAKTNFFDQTLPAQNPGDPAPYKGVQKYTFTATSVVSNVRYMITQTQNLLGGIENVIDITKTPLSDTLVSGILLSGYSVPLTIHYKADLNDRLVGFGRADAVRLTLYIIYFNGAEDKMVSMNINIQDCTCGCPVKAGGTNWLVFMCHNLGADPNKSIADQMNYTPSPNTESSTDNTVFGNLYQWGRKPDGHEERNSAVTGGPISSLDNGQPTGSNIGKFIYSPSSPCDWRTPQDNYLWRTSAGAKTVNDPCPFGWRVPTQTEWGQITSANTWIWSGSSNTKGWTAKIDANPSTPIALFLPSAGLRWYENGLLQAANLYGFYWSSSVSGVSAYNCRSHINHILSPPSTPQPAHLDRRVYGFSVRCIVE